MIDIATQLGAIDRTVERRHEPTGEIVVVRIRRTYGADIDDVWDALTNPERMPRWFLPVTGDLRPGGSFQLEGNADGTILECAPPERLRVTFGGPSSFLELQLTRADGTTTNLVLEHTVPIEIAQNGAGALFVGPGWDAGIVALDLHLTGTGDDPLAAAESLELGRASVEAWTAAVHSSNSATDDEIAFVAEMALAQFATE